MNVKITVRNHFTKETIIDSIAKGIQGGWATVQKNQKVFANAYPDCYVNFVEVDDDGMYLDGFIFGMPVNQEKDEEAYENGHMTWAEYCNKWYRGDMAGCNEDMPDDEVERQIDELLEQDWEERDAICH